MAANIQPVSLARHRDRRWHRYADFGFAATTTAASLAAAEIGQAALTFPLAFVQRGKDWELVAVLGLFAGQNVYVDSKGIWQSRYVPASFRGYPFLIGTRADGEPTLCVDEGSGLVVDGTGGEAFFDEAGALSASVAQVSKFLVETARSEAVLIEAANLLAQYQLIEEWPIALQIDGQTQPAKGWYRVNESALNGLDAAKLADLHSHAALGVAYAQLLSTSNLPLLGQLVQARVQEEAAERARAAAKPIVVLPDDSSIDWDWSKVGR